MTALDILATGTDSPRKQRMLLQGLQKGPNRSVITTPNLSTFPQVDIPRGQSSILDSPKQIHLLGVGGAGVSGAARLLDAMGHSLTGFDREASDFSKPLEAEGIAIAYGDSNVAALPEGTQLVIRSAAVGDSDPQVVSAREKGITIMKYADVLGWMSRRFSVLGVAGTHGKTTSSWMLYHAMSGIDSLLADSDPQTRTGVLVGGLHGELRINAVAPEGSGPLVLEACEYDRTFLRIDPKGALITNVEADHLDYYGDLAAIHQAFACFASQVSSDGLLVVGSQVPDVVAESASCEVWRLGKEIQVETHNQRRGMSTFSVKGPGWNLSRVRLSVPGNFNVENAAVALSLAMGLAQRKGLDLQQAAEAAARGIQAFTGTVRRFESWGTPGGVELVHDYAHHPTEVRVTLETARRTMPGKPIHVLFQPHQHSRTARFLHDFVDALQGAARVVVADVYGARAHIDVNTAGAGELVDALIEAGVPAVRGGDLRQSSATFAHGLNGVCGALILGAGDIDGIKDELRNELALRCS
ncbi:MAG: UDP-N-acetylmuramate--alanine ligase [Planctomycetota bacterium]|jgi:UDP-N-acetylmuramate--alanine ligase